MNFLPGRYAYVGSAMGPGGVAARVNRHLKKDKKTHWHIDYLRPFARIIGTIVGEQKKEHQWATRLINQPFWGKPIKGFGCTDCKCQAHLFFFRQQLDPHRVAHLFNAQWVSLLSHGSR